MIEARGNESESSWQGEIVSQASSQASQISGWKASKAMTMDKVDRIK